MANSFDDIIRQVLAQKLQTQPVGDVIPFPLKPLSTPSGPEWLEQDEGGPEHFWEDRQLIPKFKFTPMKPANDANLGQTILRG